MTAEQRTKKICDANIDLRTEVGYQMVLAHLSNHAKELCEKQREMDSETAYLYFDDDRDMQIEKQELRDKILANKLATDE